LAQNHIRRRAMALSIHANLARAAPSNQTSEVQPEPPPASASVDDLVSYASAMFKAQKFAEAGQSLHFAYQREPRPIFLFNAGQAYRKGERYSEAKAAYSEFLQVAPDHRLASEARGYVATLTALLEQRERSQQIEMALSDQKAESERAKQLSEENRAKAEANRAKAEQAEKALADEQTKQKKFYRRPWFWGLVGAGVVLGGSIAAGVLIAGAQRKTDATVAATFQF
jgi:tetratricopeptide (TPR) repeat protein